MLIFHRNRRDLFAKGLFDIFKLTAVAACVSGFFPNLDQGSRIIILSIMAITCMLSFMFCPPYQKED